MYLLKCFQKHIELPKNNINNLINKGLLFKEQRIFLLLKETEAEIFNPTHTKKGEKIKIASFCKSIF